MENNDKKTAIELILKNLEQEKADKKKQPAGHPGIFTGNVKQQQPKQSFIITANNTL